MALLRRAALAILLSFLTLRGCDSDKVTFSTTVLADPNRSAQGPQSAVAFALGSANDVYVAVQETLPNQSLALVLYKMDVSQTLIWSLVAPAPITTVNDVVVYSNSTSATAYARKFGPATLMLVLCNDPAAETDTGTLQVVSY
jgi:hypothetical protein